MLLECSGQGAELGGGPIKGGSGRRSSVRGGGGDGVLPEGVEAQKAEEVTDHDVNEK